MSPFKLHVPRGEAANFSDDLTSWASLSGRDPRLTVINEPWKTTNGDSPIYYLAFVDESFFEQFPAWRSCIEQ